MDKDVVIKKLKERVTAWKWEARRYKEKWSALDLRHDKLLKLLWFTLAAFLLQMLELGLWIWWIKCL